MPDKKPAAPNLDEASIIMDGQNPLVFGTPLFKQFYIFRPYVESGMIREAKRAARGSRSFCWFFTGHTGAGKSTELFRILDEPDIKKKYLPIYIDLASDLDLFNLEYTDLILAMGKGCLNMADEEKVKAQKRLKDTVDKWGAEIFTEEEINTRTEGQAGLRLSLPFVAFGEEVKSGGSKRTLIRKKISGDILGFIKLIDEAAFALLDKTGRQVLCVLDGLDHADMDICYKILNDHYETITRPQISKLIVIPLPLLNTSLLPTIGRSFSTVPNIKVFEEPGLAQLDPDGFQFYKEVISRYISLDLFEEEALESLFELSAGIVRDMIRNTGDACAYASDENAPKVTKEHAARVWNEIMRLFRSQLLSDDYDVLRKVNENPRLKGVDGIPPLLHSKAVVFYPNGEGWYGVHPVIKRMLEK